MFELGTRSTPGKLSRLSGFLRFFGSGVASQLMRMVSFTETRVRLLRFCLGWMRMRIRQVLAQEN